MINTWSATVTVVGAMNLDIVAMAQHPVAGDDSTPGRVRIVAGGVGRNIAENLARLSVDCRLRSVVGDDFAGELLLSQCRAAGLNTQGVACSPDHATPVYVSMNDSAGAMLHAVSDMALIDQCSADRLPLLAQDIQASDLCVIDANLSEELIGQVAGHCGDVALVAEAVSLSKCTRLASVLPRLHLLKLNLSEARHLVGANDDMSLDSLAASLLAMGPASVLISFGADGALYATEDDGRRLMHREAAPVARVVNANGAGDALLAGFIVAGLAGYDTITRLQWGTEAARLTLESDHACSQALTLRHLEQLEKR
jgi:pseudouridine kinase